MNIKKVVAIVSIVVVSTMISMTQKKDSRESDNFHIPKMSAHLHQSLDNIIDACKNNPALRVSPIQDLIWQYCGTHHCTLFFYYKAHCKPDDEITQALEEQPESKASFSWAPVKELEFNETCTKLRAHLWDSTQIIWDLTITRCIYSNIYKTFMLGFDDNADKKDDVIGESPLYRAHCKHGKNHLNINIETHAFKLIKAISTWYSKKRISS